MKHFPEAGIYPVIHRHSTEQSLEAAGLAQELGAKGAFVIDHRSTAQDPTVLLETYTHIKDELPDFWLGINNLALASKRSVIVARAVSADGVWVDNAGSQVADDELVVNNPINTIYFGGLAMKGSGYIEDPETAAQFIHDNLGIVDVAVTSGPATGQACPPERLEAIRHCSPNAKLAIASGVDLENIRRHSQLIDYILVASSVETHQYSGVFDEQALGELIAMDAEVRAV